MGISISGGGGGTVSTPTSLAAYDASTAYTTGQFVTYSGDIYKCIQNGTGKTPSNEAAYWTGLSVFKGWQLVGDYTLSAAALDQTLSSLACDTDPRWKVEWSISAPTENTYIYAQFNGDTNMNYRGGGYYILADTVMGYYAETPEQTFVSLGCGINANADIMGYSQLFLQSGVERTGISQGTTTDGVGANGHHQSYRGCWTNTADEVTSITLKTTEAVTGWVKIYKWASLL